MLNLRCFEAGTGCCLHDSPCVGLRYSAVLHSHILSAAAAALPPAGLVGVSAASSAIYARIAPLLLGLVEFGDGLIELILVLSCFNFCQACTLLLPLLDIPDLKFEF